MPVDGKPRQQGIAVASPLQFDVAPKVYGFDVSLKMSSGQTPAVHFTADELINHQKFLAVVLRNTGAIFSCDGDSNWTYFVTRIMAGESKELRQKWQEAKQRWQREGRETR